MSGFLIQSVVASIVLTLLINVIPRLFPQATRNAERRVHDTVEQAWRGVEPGQAKVKVFFPWKAMLIISIILTVVVNAVGYFAT